MHGRSGYRQVMRRNGVFSRFEEVYIIQCGAIRVSWLEELECDEVGCTVWRGEGSWFIVDYVCSSPILWTALAFVTC